MTAIAIDDFGATPTLRDLPLPEPGDDEVLVRVQASSIIGFDLPGLVGPRLAPVIGFATHGSAQDRGGPRSAA